LGPLAGLRPGRPARAIPPRRQVPPRPDPHQQHQSHPRRRQPRASHGAGCRLRNRLRWHGVRTVIGVGPSGPTSVGVTAMASAPEELGSPVFMATQTISEKPPLLQANFIAGFQAIAEERYHHKHPFHLLMHEGKLTRGHLQAWALNRYYYQSRIPIKDAAILARSEDPAFRLAWRKRILDHDGDGAKPGGIEKWLRLVEATGIPREQALSGEGILPATRYAVQAYVDFVSTRSHLEAVASSLTELFSTKLIVLRMDRLRQHYPWLTNGLDYFTGRLTQAPEDSDFALAWVVKHASTREEQDQAHTALRAKCDILWAQLDALYFAYVNPGWPPQGAFVPEKSE